MLRGHFSTGRICLAIGLLAVGLACTPVAIGQNAKAKKPSIHDKLTMEIETKDFTIPMTLKDFVQRLHDKVAEKGVDLVILIDVVSFKNEDATCPNPYDAQVQFPAFPKTLTVAEALRCAIGSIPSNSAVMLLRNGRVYILTRDAASLRVLLQQTVLPHQFDKIPFADAMRQVSEMTGVTILLDPRLKEKAETAISADFRGEVPVEAVLRILSDMVELRIVLVEGGVYVTTPCNADALEKQVRERKLAREKEEAK